MIEDMLSHISVLAVKCFALWNMRNLYFLFLLGFGSAYLV